MVSGKEAADDGSRIATVEGVGWGRGGGGERERVSKLLNFLFKVFPLLIGQGAF